jgi:tetratricopeptide (TPR) repeat protein
MREPTAGMAVLTSNAIFRAVRRLAPAGGAALFAVTLCACSFDLGSFSLSDKEAAPKPQATPTAEISAANVSDAPALAAQGQVLARSGKAAEAQAVYDKALALDPYNVQALYGRGLIYQGEKQHAEAIADFSAAHGLSPQRADPLVARAISYLAQEKVREAAGDLDEAVQSEPNNAQAWSTRGQPYEKLGDKPKASASYSRAIAIQPRDNAARAGLARVGG